MRSLLFIAVFALFMAAMDLYAFRGLHQLLPDTGGGNKLWSLIFWGISGLMFVALLLAGARFRMLRDPSQFYGVMVIMGIFLMIYVPKLLFNIFQLAGDLTVWIPGLFHLQTGGLRQWILRTGTVSALALMVAFAMGMIRGRNNVKVFREEIAIRDLPPSFDGMTVVQISDLHLGGFYHHRSHIASLVEQINRLKPDLLLFTGDMVNNFSEEVDPFIRILEGLKAPLGKFAILGNHDYGHYFQWESTREEQENLDRVKQKIREAGFDLLLNEHRTIGTDGASIELVGVENWGKPPFPQQGDLGKALQGTDPAKVKILMSHDPSHWDLKVRGKAPIQLTLSGHTHAMQIGLEIGSWHWSPSRWTYKQWAGLYKENGQYLYVNRGLGFTGFPGRVGIRPEITLLTLVPAG
ncbi:MAG: metallophosphoesterase [Bacteroidales bacterium]